MLSRNGLSTEEAEKRLNSQVSNEERCSIADIIIQNIGSVEEMQQQAKQVFDELSEIST